MMTSFILQITRILYGNIAVSNYSDTIWKYSCILFLEGYRCEDLCRFATQIKYEMSHECISCLERHANSNQFSDSI